MYHARPRRCSSRSSTASRDTAATLLQCVVQGHRRDSSNHRLLPRPLDTLTTYLTLPLCLLVGLVSGCPLPAVHDAWSIPRPGWSGGGADGDDDAAHLGGSVIAQEPTRNCGVLFRSVVAAFWRAIGRRAGSSAFGTSSFSASTYAYRADASYTHGYAGAGQGGGGGVRGSGGDGALRFHEGLRGSSEGRDRGVAAAGYWSADGHDYSPPSPASSTPSRSAPHSTSSSSAHARPLSSAAHAHLELELDPDSPLSATSSSFTHTASSFARTSTGSALPPHVAWAEEAYPASPRSVAHSYEYDEYGYEAE
ncbi:hypothetical protein C8R47DRAFT_1211494 [Mycena vitilis]|nr:hypothetical protein C8R47DRAFT_1211494 [Mycena vitilis]